MRWRFRVRPMTKLSLQLFWPVFFVVLASCTSSASAVPSDPCDPPVDLQPTVANKFPGTRVAHLSDLNDDDRTVYTKDHGTRCPGLVEVDFYGDGKPTWALVLISGDDVKHKAELVVAHRKDDGWRFQSLDTADGRTPVVWREKPGKYADVYGRKTIHTTHPVIVFCGYESWAVVYSWNGKAVEKVWISD
jgi:hypothetical protein